jgi:putative NADH-flavin reductase
MKLAIVGATGPSGLALVRQALAAGHRVTALARDPARISLRAAGLVIVRGDATVAADADRLVAGQDAVLSLLGPSRSAPRGIVSTGTRHILEAMQRRGVRRLVCVSVAGIPMPQDQRGPFAIVLDRVIRLLLPSVYQDRAQQIRLLQESDRDWVAIRASRLTDGPRTDRYRLGYPRLGPHLSISREDLAACLLAQVSDDTWLRQAPIISYGDALVGA